MTIVCCWLNNSYGRNRITALADTRATLKLPSGEYKTLTDTTTKLFRIRVRCHELDGFDIHTGCWTHPYYETEIGIGFAGSCFEAFTIIALISHSLEELVAPNGGRPKPEPNKIADMVQKIVDRYFTTHTDPASKYIELMLFGFSPNDCNPWLFNISYQYRQGVTVTSLSLGPNDFHAIGVTTKYQQRVNDLRKKINRHKNKLRQKNMGAPNFQFELEAARHDSADSKAIEEETLKKIYYEFAATIGGTLQKMEAFESNRSTVISFTFDDRPYILNRLPAAGKPSLLGYIPVVEKMGRR